MHRYKNVNSLLFIIKMTNEENLKEIIEQGKWNYILTRGVLYFGGFMFLFMIFFQKFIFEVKIDNSDIIFNFIIWAIAGLIFGFWTWSNINKKFKEKLKN